MCFAMFHNFSDIDARKMFPVPERILQPYELPAASLTKSVQS
jgi:hypothetical protein